MLHYYGDHIPNIFGRKGHDPAGALPGYDYDVLSEELLLEKLTFADGKLRLPSGMSYHVLSLPDHRVLSLAALRKIDALARAGANVLGPKPLKAVSLVGGHEGVAGFRKLADGLWGTKDAPQDIRAAGKGRVAWGMTASEFLAIHDIGPDLTISSADGGTAAETDWIHYRIGEADVYFLAELGGKPRDIRASFRTAGRVPELWNPVDGSIRDATCFTIADGRTRVPIDTRRLRQPFHRFPETDHRDRARHRRRTSPRGTKSNPSAGRGWSPSIPSSADPPHPCRFPNSPTGSITRTPPSATTPERRATAPPSI